MLPPSPPLESEWIVSESTYGNRAHAAEDLQLQLKDVLVRTIARRGVVVVPAFAVGRAQLLLHAIANLQSSGAIPEVPVYLNSPMATDVTALMVKTWRSMRKSYNCPLRRRTRTRQKSCHGCIPRQGRLAGSSSRMARVTAGTRKPGRGRAFSLPLRANWRPHGDSNPGRYRERVMS